MDDNSLIMQIKKERLDRHLGEVERLIAEWIPQLSATDPFASYTRGDSWGWPETYRPGLQQDADSNHMLRRHLRSRALWAHHSDWGSRLEGAFELSTNVREKAAHLHHGKGSKGKSGSRAGTHTEGYLGAALWQAFRLARNHPPDTGNYRRGDGGKGVGFGGYLIETSSASEKRFTRIRQEHLSLSYELSGLDEMKAIAEEWALIEKLQSQMQTLASKALKSSDFLYPCRFCKRLWKA